jgi:hypothetical protein
MLHDDFRRALHDHALPPAGRSVQRHHELLCGIEWNHVDAWPSRAVCIRFETDLRSRHDQRDLGRVTYAGPCLALQPQRRVVAQNAGQEEVANVLGEG